MRFGELLFYLTEMVVFLDQIIFEYKLTDTCAYSCDVIRVCHLTRYDLTVFYVEISVIPGIVAEKYVTRIAVRKNILTEIISLGLT